MKKMLRLEESGLDFGFCGKSDKEGIFFRIENREKEDRTGQIKYRGAKAVLNNDKSIFIKREETQKEELIKLIDVNNKDIIITMCLKLSFMLLAIITGALSLFFLTKQKIELCGIFYGWTCIFFCANRLSQYVYAIAKRLLREDDMLKLCRLHSAEHAAINAFYDLHRVPTLEEIKKYSWFSYTCSVAKDFYSYWFLLGIGICGLFYGVYFFIALTIFILISCWGYKRNFYFTEIILLSKPTIHEYQTAIIAMKLAVQQKEITDAMSEVDLNGYNKL